MRTVSLQKLISVEDGRVLFMLEVIQSISLENINTTKVLFFLIKNKFDIYYLLRAKFSPSTKIRIRKSEKSRKNSKKQSKLMICIEDCPISSNANR